MGEGISASLTQSFRGAYTSRHSLRLCEGRGTLSSIAQWIAEVRKPSHHGKVQFLRDGPRTFRSVSWRLNHWDISMVVNHSQHCNPQWRQKAFIQRVGEIFQFRRNSTLQCPVQHVGGGAVKRVHESGPQNDLAN
ncbi:hypothetical protein T265_06421 [Opisthorchis viverrini]|uniref:Uncharacterized protein n=1 Tax=Opisthorchis viverrini TaxID=6198 RepID=A0A074ZSG6_OPIVI|nr:hypothetical protein T265_06421 [Opisthorchis viverrini]KER26305.1 hypothetical protein T265_06421 [Opisthorchis viverrini]